MRCIDGVWFIGIQSLQYILYFHPLFLYIFFALPLPTADPQRRFPPLPRPLLQPPSPTATVYSRGGNPRIASPHPFGPPPSSLAPSHSRGPLRSPLPAPCVPPYPECHRLPTPRPTHSRWTIYIYASSYLLCPYMTNLHIHIYNMHDAHLV